MLVDFGPAHSGGVGVGVGAGQACSRNYARLFGECTTPTHMNDSVGAFLGA